jgi:hypothetical protein
MAGALPSSCLKNSQLEAEMKKDAIRKMKWFWPWQDAREEAWLEEMSKQGLHLKQPHIWGEYEFIKSLPKSYLYRLDFRDSMKQKDKDAYVRLFTDLGWEHIGEVNGWQYFRREANPGDPQELYTDVDSKIQKYNRLLTWLGLMYPSYLVIFIALWSEYPEWAMWLTVGIILTTSAVWLLITAKIWQRIRQLKKL